MAEKLEALVDHFSGLPSPLLPYAEAPDRPVPPSAPERDDHHPQHPRVIVLSMEDDGAEAIRHCRVQRAWWADHHEPYGYHTVLEGPESLPETVDERFKVVFWAWTGYVPEIGIDIRAKGDDPRFVAMTPEQREQLMKRTEMRVEKPELVRQFMTRVVLGQDLGDINESIRDEFLHTESTEQRRSLGKLLLSKAITRSTKDLELMYRSARKNGLIKSSFEAETAAQFVTDRIAHQRRTPVLVEALKTKLAS